MAQEVNNRFRHILPIQIRFNDVDKFGHVNNTVYFQFYDLTCHKSMPIPDVWRQAICRYDGLDTPV